MSNTAPGTGGTTAVTNVRVFDGQGLLGGDPLQDIRATRSIRRVWCGGIERVPLTQG